MNGCRIWIRDEDDVAAFRCGDKSKDGVELCPECKEIHRKQSIVMNGQQCKLSNSDSITTKEKLLM